MACGVFLEDICGLVPSFAALFVYVFVSLANLTILMWLSPV